MTSRLEKKVARWTGPPGPDVVDYIQLYEAIGFLDDHLFSSYLPAVAAEYPGFDDRLDHWLENLSADEDAQKTLLRFVPEVFFVGSYEFAALYRSALTSAVNPWLIDELNLNMRSKRLAEEVSAGIESTWFCSVTDSMHVADFYHCNGLGGVDHRPDWHSLSEFGCGQRILQYMKVNGLKRVVLLEDFVGSGSQMIAAVEYACTQLEVVGASVLLAPLVCCPVGAEAGDELASRIPNLTFAPVLTVDSGRFLGTIRMSERGGVMCSVANLAVDTYMQVVGYQQPSSYTKPYGPLGFMDTGATVVTFSNCPDNTVPLLSHGSDHWKPLFPRSSRI